MPQKCADLSNKKCLKYVRSQKQVMTKIVFSMSQKLYG